MKLRAENNLKIIVISDMPHENEWVIFNTQETGYYRVNYDDRNWQNLINLLIQNHSKIHDINRAQILNDGLNLARAGMSF